MADVQSNIKVSIDTTDALASIKNLQRQISAFHTSMARSGAAANAVTGQMQQNLINSINATGKFSAQMKTIKTTTESFTDSLQKNKFSLGEYFRYAGGASKSFGRLFKTEFETINKVARENVKDLQTQYIKMGRDANGAMKAIAVRPLTLDMNDLATKTMIASEKQALLNQLLKQGSTNLLNFGKNTQWAGRQLMVGFTIPLMAAGTAAAKSFMDMEKQAIRFKKVYGDLFTSTEESTAALENIKELGKSLTQYGIAVADTVGVASEAAAAGFAGVDLQRQTEQSIRLSILGQVDYQKALETTISVQNAFGISSDQLAESIDFLNAVENQTVVSLDDITTAIPKVAPVIKQLGGDVKDLAFLMTAMKEGGINASEGANALKSGLASMINPTGKATAMLESFGINIKKIVVDNKGDLKKTVVEFATALNELDPLNRAQAIEQMFGKFQFARLSTLFANVTKDGTQAARVLDLAGSSVQELAKLSEKELGMTAESSMNKFKKAVEDLKLALVPVGEEFLKAVTPVAQFVSDILEKFNGLSAGTKKIIVTITAIVAGLGPVFLMTFGLLANGLANIIKGFTFLKSIFNKASQSTSTLGTEVKYMTAEQRNAAAVAASLDQVHKTLAQTFTAEASAVDALTRAYQRSIAAQSQFVPSAKPMVRGPIKKRAKGKPSVVGGIGNQDSELAYLMPGETVIPTDMSKKYGGLINGMIADNIPGYGKGKVSMYPEFALRLQDAAENMGQRSGQTGVPNVLAPLALRIGEARGIAPTQGQIDAGSFDNIYDEYEDITTQFVDKLNNEYNETFKDIQDENERMQKAWSSAGKHIEEQVKSIESETEKGIVRKTFGLEKDEYGTIPTDSREAGGTKPNRARRGAFKAKLAGYRSYTALRPGAKRLFERKTGRSAKNLQMGHVYGPIEEDISTLQADPRKSGAVDSAAKILARGEKDGKEYKKGVEKSTKDPYVVSRDRNSPHALAAQDGKDDAIAYENAKEKEIASRNKKNTQSKKPRRIATRAQGPAPVGPDAPAGTGFLPIVTPLTDEEKRKDKKQKQKAKAKNKLKLAGSKMNSFGGGMGLMGVNMAMGMAPDFAGKGMAQGALAGANLGMMFGPQGMAVGATIGLISVAISDLIEKEKQLRAMTEATFKSSADMATFFGNAVVDTTLRVGALSSSLGIVGSSAENAGKSFGYTNEELAQFINLVQSLPEGNPLKDLIDGLTDEKNPDKINEIAKAFVTTQVALGQIKPDQAQKSLDLILASSGKASMVGSSFINLSSQVQAVSQSLKNASSSSSGLGTSLTQLVGAASNASSLAQITVMIDGIAASGISAAQALGSMYNAYLAIGNIGAANSILNLNKIKGLTPEQIARAMIAASKGYTEKIDRFTNAADFDKRVIKFLSNPELFKNTSDGGVTQTKAYKSQEEEVSTTKKQIKLLQQKKKIIDDQIKQQEKLTNEIKRQNDYLDKQRDIDQQIVDAKIKGNYIEAASLLQEKTQNTIEFNQETQKSKLQEQADALQAQIDALQLRNDEVVAAINKSAEDQAASATADSKNIIAAIQGGYPSKDKQDGSTASKAFSIPTTSQFVKGFVGEQFGKEGSHGQKAAMKSLDAKYAFKDDTSKGFFQSYVKSFIQADLDKLANPDDSIVISAVGSDGFTYTFRAFKDGRFTRGKAIPPKPTGVIPTSPTLTKPKLAQGGYINNFDGGGNVSGPGTATSDSIPAMLSDGEYVFSARAVDAAGGPGVVDGWHNALRRADGGPVGNKTKISGSLGVIGGNAKPAEQIKTALETPYDTAKRLYQEENKKVIKIPVPPIRANFSTNSYDLNKEQREELQAIAKQLIKSQIKSMVVQGHADSRGGVDNDLLSLNRAKATAAYLAKLVPGTSFVPVGHGIYKPLAPNTSAENMALNRRAELFLPDQYKTIYPDFNPKQHTSMMIGGGTVLSNGSISSTIDFGKLFSRIKSAIGFANGGQVGQPSAITKGYRFFKDALNSSSNPASSMLMGMLEQAGTVGQTALNRLIPQLVPAPSKKQNKDLQEFSGIPSVYRSVAGKTSESPFALETGNKDAGKWMDYLTAAGMFLPIKGTGAAAKPSAAIRPSTASATVMRNLQIEALKSAESSGRLAPNMMSPDQLKLSTAITSNTSDLGGALRKYWGDAYEILAKEKSESIAGLTKESFFEKISKLGESGLSSSMNLPTQPTDFVKAANIAYMKAHGLDPSQPLSFYKAVRQLNNDNSAAGYFSLSGKFAASYLKNLNVGTGVGSNPTAGLYKADLTVDKLTSLLGMGGMSDEFTNMLHPDIIKSAGNLKRIGTGASTPWKSLNDGPVRYPYLRDFFRPTPYAGPGIISKEAIEQIDSQGLRLTWDQIKKASKLLPNGDRSIKKSSLLMTSSLDGASIKANQSLLENIKKIEEIIGQKILVPKFGNSGIGKNAVSKDPEVQALIDSAMKWNSARGKELSEIEAANPDFLKLFNLQEEARIESFNMQKAGKHLKNGPVAKKLYGSDPTPESELFNKHKANNSPYWEYESKKHFYQKELDQLTKAQKFNITPAEVIALRNYLEKPLYGHLGSLKDPIEKLAQRYEIPQGMVSYRALSNVDLQALSGLKVGESFISPTVRSITNDRDTAAKIAAFGGTGGDKTRSLAKIIFESGIKGIDDISKLGENQGLVHEGLIANNTRFILEGINKASALASRFENQAGIHQINNFQGSGKIITEFIDEYILRAVKMKNGGMVRNKIAASRYNLPSYEVGSPYIPEDQIAQLHKGERVLTAQENKNFSASGPVTNNITINGADKDPKQIAQEVMIQLERIQSKNNKTNLVGR